jgi:hypothetical protein
MADKKITELADAATIAGTEELPVVQSSTTKRATVAELTPGLAAASTSASGIVELATSAETVAGTDTTRAVTASGAAGLANANNTGIWHTGNYFGPTGSSTTMDCQRHMMYYVPFVIERPVTVTRISAEVTTGLASSTVRLGIYTDNGGWPDQLIVDGGTIDGNSATVQEVTVSSALTIGRVWVTCCRQGSAGSHAMRANTGGVAVPVTANGQFAIGTIYDGAASTSGALPSTAVAPSGVTGSTYPRLMLKAT